MICRSDVTKRCFKCGETKPLSHFYKHPKMSDGYLNKCKECAKLDVRINRQENLEYYQEYDRIRGRQHDSERYKSMLEYGKRPEVRKSRNQLNARHKQLFPHKHKARSAVSNAIRDGKVEKPVCCEYCGNTENIQAHHSSYAADMQLLVTWLCAICHGEVHRDYE